MIHANEVYDTAHRDALIYGYGFIVVNRSGGVSTLSPQYVVHLLDEIEENIEGIKDD